MSELYVIQKMTYPSEYALIKGEVIKIGDLIWYNEGVGVGFVYDIITTPEEWGLEDSETGIMIQSLHPLQTKEKEHSPGLYFNSESLLEDEGVGRLTGHEINELNHAISIALEEFNSLDPIYTVSAYKDMTTEEECWHIRFFKENKISIEMKIPFRPNTRNKKG